MSEEKITNNYYLAYGTDLAYLLNAKAGCTTMRTSLTECRHLPQPIGHLQLEQTFHFFQVVKYKSLLPSFYKTFTFVRHPYDRFVSFYANKIWNSLELNNEKSGLQFYKKLGFYTNMTLDNAAQALVKLDHSLLEFHLYPQSLLLTDGEKLYADYIAKLENFEEEWQLLNEIFFIPIQIKPRNISKKNPKKLRDALSEETKFLLYEYYKNDFELFDYPAEINIDSANTTFQKGISLSALDSEQIEVLKRKIHANHLQFKQRSELYKENPQKKQEDFQTHQFRMHEYNATQFQNYKDHFENRLHQLEKKLKFLSSFTLIFNLLLKIPLVNFLRKLKLRLKSKLTIL